MQKRTKETRPWNFDIDAYLADTPQRRRDDWYRHVPLATLLPR